MLSLVAERSSKHELADAPAPRENGVLVEGVTKRFGDVVALHEAHLDVARGELMTLLGPSGCGKTTLLNLVAGFLLPNSGMIRIDGRVVTDVPTYRREIGMLFQNYALFPHMNVAANVGYGLRMRGVAKAEMARRVGEAMALVKLTGFEDRKPRQLSGGQQQRVALARALVIRPKVLLLDEPFSALDKNLRASMQIELKEIQRELGVTTIFVTHDQSEALSLSDRIAVLSEGRIRQVGTPDEIYRHPLDPFVASFVGDVNVFRARLERVEGSTATVRVGQSQIMLSPKAVRDVAPGAALDLYVRPEDVRAAALGEAATCTGTVTAHIYQGGYVDLHLEASEAKSGRLLIRLAGHDAATRWPVGARVPVAINSADAVAFPASAP